MHKKTKAQLRIECESMSLLTKLLYGTWTPPKSTSQRTYRHGRLVNEQHGANSFGYGQLESIILMTLGQNKPHWLTRGEIADEVGAHAISLFRPLQNLAKSGAIKNKKVACDRGRPTHVYRLA